MAAQYIIAGDLGTGSCKTVLVDEAGRVVAAAGAEYPTHYPRPGWAEQDPADWYAAFVKTVRAVLDQSGIAPGQVAAVTVAGVTHNAVLMDADDQPLRPSIIIHDTRSAAESTAIRARWGADLYGHARNDVSPVWTWPQLAWLRAHEQGVFAATRRMLFQKDYVRHCLAPGYVTDLIDASGTLLYDPVRLTWIDAFRGDLGLPCEAYPEVQPPTQQVSCVSAQGATHTGLLQGTPVIVGTTDTAAEVLGAGALWRGQATVKLASVGRIAVVAEGPADDLRALNYRHVLDGLWYPGAASKFAASAYRWLRDTMWLEHDAATVYHAMDMAAASVPPGSGGLIFHPHLLGEWAPYWDDTMRADFIGVTARHGRPHFTRAVLEGVACALRDALSLMETLGLPIDEVRLIGGGAASPLWAEIVCNTLGRPLRIPHEGDAAYGAALVAGIGVGMFGASAHDLDRIIAVESEVRPDPALTAHYDELYQLYRDADTALQPLAARLSRFESQFYTDQHRHVEVKVA